MKVRGLCAAGLVSVAVFAVAQPVGTPQSAEAAKPAAPMTKAQGDELLRSVDEILQFASKDTHLAIKSKVKKKLLSRGEVNKFLVKKFEEDKGAQRLERSEVILKKFGLLDHDFHLRPFLISLLTEQIAGFYDPKTRTVNLLDWVAVEEQKPVMAHELTHALQDQRVEMDKWSDPLSMEISKDARDDNRHIQSDEANTSRDAVAEGQAMVVFVDYALKPSGKTLADSPDLGEKMQDMAGDSSGSPLMARAPLLLQKSLLFPYTTGLAFEQVLLRRGVDVAFAGALDRPPSSSHEVMHPQDYLSRTPVPLLTMPDIHPLLDKDWAPYDVGVMGELDVAITTELFGGKEIASAVAPEWAGGIYFAAQKRSAITAEQKQSTASLGLMYYSQWKNEDSARSFMRVYASQLGRKYSKLSRVVEKDPDDDHQIFETNEGDVVLSLDDKGVYVSEGFDRETARKMEEMVRGAQGTGPLRSATLQMPGTGPSENFASWMSGFGMMKFALQSK
ncbi:hypothetical protein [Terriglobus saanensis]|uniref:DUF4157 domain-containing protein n=1 Tax=Terriglobus saanensis (strain ATCC BAA-1853 / DSM 23119 / SP1PR4) TaxID=401053 RepID=E8V5K9_TERSS|nr:hypothetical protein [Terriglobus saanensis]ADV81543.1 hypothetical protein AciPR4_0710 [Terriglobus saanensis SP1PR4]